MRHLLPNSVVFFFTMQMSVKMIRKKEFLLSNQYKDRMFGLVYLSRNHAAGVFPVIFLNTM